ncbi:SNF2 family N-terminal domain containing protein [Tritrichomonas foetus]|uniref:SNF2 family N-terminal domain containing protein n=1 Tax=Tritrichomonas foetus TaxID=1144522 RepID=A0A1J4KVF8_9EUKA|nr:SNF2 family N-terminal domain containing protein [Tritrichomonas foetus]|eukprot:OHT15223.1 SNF2 family N-terminal domain containing protein [Tritrichomonas foetus]
MSNNQSQLNQNIFNNEQINPNGGGSPFSDNDQHSLFNPNYNPQQMMMNGLASQLQQVGAHDINSLLSSQQNAQAFSNMNALNNMNNMNNNNLNNNNLGNNLTNNLSNMNNGNMGNSLNSNMAPKNQGQIGSNSLSSIYSQQQQMPMSSFLNIGNQLSNQQQNLMNQYNLNQLNNQLSNQISQLSQMQSYGQMNSGLNPLQTQVALAQLQMNPQYITTGNHAYIEYYKNNAQQQQQQQQNQQRQNSIHNSMPMQGMNDSSMAESGIQNKHQHDQSMNDSKNDSSVRDNSMNDSTSNESSNMTNTGMNDNSNHGSSLNDSSRSLQNQYQNQLHNQYQNSMQNQGFFQNHMQNSYSSSLQNSYSGTMQGSMSNNMSNNMQNNLSNNMQNNLQNNMQNNMQNNIQNNMQNNMQNNLQNNTQNNMQNGISNSSLQTSLASSIQQNLPPNLPPTLPPTLPSTMQLPPTLAASLPPNLPATLPPTLPVNRNMTPTVMMHLLMQRQKTISPHARSRPGANKKFISEDNEEEVVDDIPSSDEAEFSESSDETDFENLPDNYVPTDVTQRRTAGRENRKTVQHDDDELYNDDESDTSDIQDIEKSQEVLLEHIYMSRIVEGGIEYLVRFQDTQPALCNWVPEVLVSVIPNSKGHLDRFRSTPFALEDLPENSNYIVPVAHRRDTPTSKPELLFRFSYDNTVLFYWDFASDKITEDYFRNRVRVDAMTPALPVEQTLPDPSENLIISKEGNSLRPYQVDGVKWLLKCWKEQHGSILADEMGLGKTIQLLAFLTYLNKYTEWHGPFLIAVRTNTFKQWCDEIENWTDLSYLPYNSGPAQRSLMREHMFRALDNNGEPIPDTFSFNIFLVSYDVLLKDVEFLQRISWEVFVVDEGHRIKNKNGKKNNAMSVLFARQRIILTGTPIQNTLEELWTLLKFVSPNQFNDSPDFIQDEQIDKLNESQILTMRDRIRPHLLRRSLQDDVEHTIAPKDERIAFVSLTPVQRDLIRLTKLHKLWRLKGVQTSEEEMDASNEAIALNKICSHPFLIPEAESYYTRKLKMKRLDLLLYVSVKFQWLDHLLVVLKREGHRVLIFSQRVELLKLLNEFCLLKNYSTELLIGSMSDSDKTSAIERFSADDSEAFIFLISTRAGSEGLNLTVANTAIIFDPDWNPQNDLQAQARCHRIGQTQKVDVFRLITYQTYEHEMFVRAQRKLGLWLTLLGTRSVDDIFPGNAQSNIETIEIARPPIISKIHVDYNQPLPILLNSMSTIVHDFSLDSMNALEMPLSMMVDYGDGNDDESFLEQFPVSVDAGTRRTKRSRSRDLLLDFDSSLKIYYLMLKFGYGEWEKIASELPEHSSEQIRRFCVCLSIFAFRAMQPSNITYLPVLVSKILIEEPDFEFNMLLCSNKHTWAQVFPEDHDYALEVDSCKKLKEKLRENSFYFLSVVEMRLIAKSWCSFHAKDSFDINTLAPPVSDQDDSILRNILNYGEFDPFNLRVQAIINKMRSDIIMAQLDDYAMKFQWWTGIEFNALMAVLKNYRYTPSEMVDFHSKTAILSKSTYQIRIFVTRLKKMLERRQKGSLLLPKDMHMMRDAPKTLQSAKGFTAWVNILVRECEDLAYREELIELIHKKVDDMPDIPETQEWSDFHTKKYLKLLIQHGVDALTDILQDRRYGFKEFLTQSDIDFLAGKKKRRNLITSTLPDFVFNEDELYAFLKGEIDPFAPVEERSLYMHNEDSSEANTITLEDYIYSEDDEITGKSRKNANQYAFSSDTDVSSTDFESQTDEQEEEFKPPEE